MLKRLGPPRVKGVPALVADEAHWALRGNPGRPHQAWVTCLKKMQAFRQNRRNNGGPRPGRSYWPEPDAIRKVTRRASPEHSTPVSKVNAFPRADFGMPIIFHFKDDRQGDPRDRSLQPSKEVDRYPSPVILRPSSKGQSMAVHLANTCAPENPYLVDRYNQDQVRKTPTARELEQATAKEKSLFAPDAITAFLNTFRG
jgi:CRISPR-associated protein Cmr1